MKILLAANGFPPAVGGTEFCNREIAKHLVARGNEVEVATWTPVEGNGVHWPFPVHRLPVGPNHDDYSCDAVPEILRRFSPDIVLISRTTRRLRTLPPILRDMGFPYAAYCHFLRSKHSSRDQVRKYLARRRFGFDGAAIVLSVSLSLAQQLHRMGIAKERIRVVHPGVDSEKFRPNPQVREKLRQELGLTGKTVISTVARVMDGKGQERVLRVLPKLIAAEPNLMYLVVGGGVILDRLKKLAGELGLSKNVHFTGFICDPVPYFNASDIFALPSNRTGVWIEAFGLSTLEAAACGLPVVASREGGAQEIVVHGETGFLVNENQQEELASFILQLVKDPALRERLGKAARAKVASEMTWSQSGEKLEGSLREAANRYWANLGSKVTSTG